MTFCLKYEECELNFHNISYSIVIRFIKLVAPIHLYAIFIL